jgi:ABC-type uncharacterized transport system permease subunit
MPCHAMPGCAVLQGMAGNIIHAIATTNAVVGGIIVSEALKILAGGLPVVGVECKAKAKLISGLIPRSHHPCNALLPPKSSSLNSSPVVLQLQLLRKLICCQFVQCL